LAEVALAALPVLAAVLAVVRLLKFLLLDHRFK
jgi:hypothetical protein